MHCLRVQVTHETFLKWDLNQFFPYKAQVCVFLTSLLVTPVRLTFLLSTFPIKPYIYLIPNSPGPSL